MLTIFHPKGSMCCVCEKRDSDCSNLEFSKMQPMRQYSKENDPNIFKVVKCDEFKR